MSMSEKEQQKNEMLSAFIDAEQSDIETIQIVDALLNESEYKERFIRTQLVNDILNDSANGQSTDFLFNNSIHKKISASLDELPAHYVDGAVNLQALSTEDVTQSSWFRRMFDNKVISGVSVAASVMFVTLFTFQHFDSVNGSADESTSNFNNSVLADSSQSAPSLIMAPSALPSNLAAAGAGTSSTNMKDQYRWVEADPELSRQVREYISEHEAHRTTYSLQPKVRAAAYRIGE